MKGTSYLGSILGRPLAWLAFVLALASSVSGALAQPAIGEVARVFDQRLLSLVLVGEKFERVATGFGFTEGVTWIPEAGGRVLFSDIPANTIYSYAPASGEVSTFKERTGYRGPHVWRVGMRFHNGKPRTDPGFEEFNMIGSNGMALDRQGRLVIATWAGRSIERVEKDGRQTVLADRFEGKRFGGPNDVIVRSDGAIYFSDGFGAFAKGGQDPRKELDRQAIYLIRGNDVLRVVDDLPKTNGLAFSPDERFLYASSSSDRYIRRYVVAADGSLGSSTLFVDLSKEQGAGITDGMKIDAQGNVWTTGPGGLWVIAPDGTRLGVVPVPEEATNLVFGGADRKTLYISANTSIYRLRVNVAGLP